MFLNSALFKVCLENNSYIFINEEMFWHSLNWIAISFLVPVLQILQAFDFQTSIISNSVMELSEKFSVAWSLYK